MRGNSSSSKSKNGEKLQEQNLPRVYIRNFVKRLSSSRTEKSDQIQSPEHHKKQVRRRLHSSRPYQERLLNMAEARREIVTALKCHRESMKKQQDNDRQRQSESRPETCTFGPGEEEAKSKSRRNPRTYASNYCAPDHLSHSRASCSHYSWPGPTITLPIETLGLNLNLDDFNYSDSSSAILSSSSSALTSSSPLSNEKIPSLGPPVASDMAEFGDSGSHHAMDDDEMAEIRSVGEKYQMEWDDSLNMVNSAWWFEFSTAMEISAVDTERFVEFPDWLNSSGSCLQQVNDDYFGDHALPCMNIEGTHGMDGDWWLA